MRISILTQRLRVGFGVDLVVHRQANGLSERGHEVRVLCFEAEADPTRKYQVEAIPPYFRHPLFWDAEFRVRLRSNAGLRERLLAGSDRVVMETFPFFGLTPALGERAALFEYGIPPQTLPGLRGKALQGIYERNFARGFGAPRLGTNSQALRQNYPSTVRDRVAVIRNGNEHVLEALAETLNAEESRTSAALTRSPYFIAISRFDYLHNYKNVALLLKLKLDFPAARIVLAGTGPKAHQELLEKSGLEILPKASPRLLYEMVRRSEGLLSPSLWEGFNLPLAEAFALGKPALAMNLPAHHEFGTPLLELASDDEDFRGRFAHWLAGRRPSGPAVVVPWSEHVAQLDTYLR